MNKNIDTPLVTVCIICYNHEKYISKAIEGAINQITDFNYKIVIYDDASTDKSQEIIAKYANLYPEKIIAICQKENAYSKKINAFYSYVFPYAKTKYIAYCEGDDYWICNTKLQKQIDFLEKHPDYYAVGHNVKFINEDGTDYNDVVPRVWTKMKSYEYTIKHYDKKHYVFAQTASTVSRNYWIENPEYYHDVYQSMQHVNGDLKNNLIFLLNGKIWFMGETMSCYRKSNKNGSYSARTKNINQCERRIYSLKEQADLAKKHGIILSFKKEYEKNLFYAFNSKRREPTEENILIYEKVLNNYSFKFPKISILKTFIFSFFHRAFVKVFHIKYI